jgi:trk system potassium uptake protein TrkH
LTVLTRPRAAVLGVDVSATLNLVGALVKYFSPAFLFPTAIALGYGESPWPFVFAGLVTAAAGLGLEAVTRGKERVGVREGFLVVTLVWLLVAAFAALPYLFSREEQLSNPVDAYFESMSGLTTTGASILPDIEALNNSLLMWRQFTVWVGGMGIIVLALAVLPRLRVGGRQMFETESPGPEVERLTVTIREAAQRFLALYLGITTAETIVLTAIGWLGLDDTMGPYEALAHSFATVATGGFSTRNRSFEEFGAATVWAVIVFMIVAGTNFALMYRALLFRRPRLFARDEEFRLYLVLLGTGSALVLVELWSEGILAGESAVRNAVFNAVSMMSTTGFASADFNEWTTLTSVTLVALMFVGASAGSTSGSIKVVRHLLIGRILRRELDQTVHPEIVSPVRLNRERVAEPAVRAVSVFVLLYIGFFAVGAFALFLDAARVDLAVAPLDVIAASASNLGNVGPAFGFAGPMGSYDAYTNVSKLVLTVLMFVGRIELIPVVVLFTRSYWRA